MLDISPAALTWRCCARSQLARVSGGAALVAGVKQASPRTASTIGRAPRAGRVRRRRRAAANALVVIAGRIDAARARLQGVRPATQRIDNRPSVRPAADRGSRERSSQPLLAGPSAVSRRASRAECDPAGASTAGGRAPRSAHAGTPTRKHAPPAMSSVLCTPEAVIPPASAAPARPAPTAAPSRRPTESSAEVRPCEARRGGIERGARGRARTAFPIRCRPGSGAAACEAVQRDARNAEHGRPAPATMKPSSAGSRSP